jgi:hypothetical protein
MAFPEFLGARLRLRGSPDLGASGGSRTTVPCGTIAEQCDVFVRRHPGPQRSELILARRMTIDSQSCDPGMNRDLGL